MLHPVKEIFTDFISLVYPGICAACNNALLKNEQSICTHCMFHLPKTNYHLNNDNPVNKLFWGRVNINAAASFYLYTKGGKVQNLIHSLKYNGQTDVGTVAGEWYGYELQSSEEFKNIDLIVPVPLHKKRLKKRGYNQSDFFALGLSKSLAVIVESNNMIRKENSSTQTKRSRYARWTNVSDLFEVSEPAKFENKHILLVDDVVTTGSTLEACAGEILKIANTKVSIATIAYAHM